MFSDILNEEITHQLLKKEKIDHNELHIIIDKIEVRFWEMGGNFLMSDRTNRKEVNSIRSTSQTGVIELREFLSLVKERGLTELNVLHTRIVLIINALNDALFRYDSRSLILDQIKAAKYTLYTSIVATVVAFAAIILTLWLYYQ